MAYSVISLKDLTELKSRRGTPTNTAIATILGLNYPIVEAYSIYVWDDTSLATPDDNEIVQPTIGGVTTGRWYKIDLDQVPQINSDWNATTGVSQILNKPTLFNGDYNTLTNKPAIPTNNNQLSNGAGYITTVPAQTWASITGKPTFKRQETYSGTTSASGVFTVTFGTAYSVAPNIQANIIGGTNTNLIKISSISTTGFTVNVTNRVDVLGLLPSYTNVSGASIDVLITEK